MEDTTLTIISICVAVISFVIAVYGVLVIIKTISADKKAKLLKTIEIKEAKLDLLLKKMDDVTNELTYLLIHFNPDNLDDKIIGILEESDTTYAKNNLGVFYLEKSRKENGGQKKYYLDKAKTNFELAINQIRQQKLDYDAKKQLSIIYVNLADAYDDLGNQVEGIAKCLEAIKYDKTNSLAYNMMASIYSDMNNSEALNTVNKAIILDQNNGYSYLTKVEILLKNPEIGSDEIKELYINALQYGCPTWQFLDKLNTDIYPDLVAELVTIAKNYELEYLRSQARLQTEHKYII